MVRRETPSPPKKNPLRPMFKVDDVHGRLVGALVSSLLHLLADFKKEQHRPLHGSDCKTIGMKASGSSAFTSAVAALNNAALKPALFVFGSGVVFAG
jgi:hypothetical protein